MIIAYRISPLIGLILRTGIFKLGTYQFYEEKKPKILMVPKDFTLWFLKLRII